MKKTKLDVIRKKISNSSEVEFVQQHVNTQDLDDFEMVNIIVVPKQELHGSYNEQISKLNALLTNISWSLSNGKIYNYKRLGPTLPYVDIKITDDIIVGYVSWYEIVTSKRDDEHERSFCRNIRLYLYPNEYLAKGANRLDERDVRYSIGVLNIPLHT